MNSATSRLTTAKLGFFGLTSAPRLAEPTAALWGTRNEDRRGSDLATRDGIYSRVKTSTTQRDRTEELWGTSGSRA